MKYEDEYTEELNPKLRKYPESGWVCRIKREFPVCAGKLYCMKRYPNLTCEKGHR